jgi:hypothetical protein
MGSQCPWSEKDEQFQLYSWRLLTVDRLVSSEYHAVHALCVIYATIWIQHFLQLCTCKLGILIRFPWCTFLPSYRCAWKTDFSYDLLKIIYRIAIV